MLAGSGWDKITSGGGYHTMQEAGRYGMKWGSFLDGDKAQSQQSWSNAAASPEGRKYMESMEEVETIGKKISNLMRDIASGGSGALRAAEELKRAQVALEDVGRAGGGAADRLGGDMGRNLHAELDETISSARAGQAPPTPESGPGAGAMLNMIQNPKGALMQGLMQQVSGLSPGMLAGLGAGAAVTGGVALGWKFNMDRASDMLKDGVNAGEDARLSRSMGPGFDFRGAYWDEDRYRAKDGLNTVDARQSLKAMGIGMGNFKGDVTALTSDITRYALDDGLDSSEMAGALGASVVSGQTKKDEGSMTSYLQKMSGYLQRMADMGVESHASLQAIASLNSQQVQALGKLAPGAGAFNSNLVEALTATGDPALRDKQGAAAMSKMGHVSGNQMPMVFGAAMKDKAGWAKSINTFFGDDAKLVLGQDEVSQMMMASENPAMVEYYQLGAMHSKRFSKTPGFALGGLLGTEGMPLLTQEKLRQNGGFDEDHLLGMTHAIFNGNGPRDSSDKSKSLHQEQFDGQRSGEDAAREQDRRLTTATYETAAKMKDAANTFHDAVFQFSGALDKFQNGMSDPGNYSDRAWGVPGAALRLMQSRR